MQDDLNRIEAPLLAEMERLEAAELPEHSVPVVIQHASEAADVVAASLRASGAADFESLPLVPALRASLTPAQIRSAASHPEVLRIIWDRHQHVVA